MVITTAEAATASAAFDSQRAGRSQAGRPAQHLAELFEAYAAMVLAICRGMLRNAHDAEDAAQQTFLSAYTSLAGGTTPREPPAWLATIARNECRTRVQRRMREPLPADGIEVDAGGDPADQAVRAEEVESLRRALARLPGQQRHAFLLREFSGLSYDELADELGVTRGAVESLLFRARQQLRVSLRTAAAAITSAPMAFRDWVAQVFGSAPETPAAAAKLGALAVLAKVAAATAGTAIVAAGVVAVAPHHHRAAGTAPSRRAPVARSSPRPAHVVRRPAPPPVRLAAAPAPAAIHARQVATAPATERHHRDHRPGDGGGSSGHGGPSSGSGGGEARTVTVPEQQDSSSGGGPGPSDDQAGTTTLPTTTAASSGEGSSGPGGGDDGGGDGGRGPGGSGSGGDGGHDSGGRH